MTRMVYFVPVPEEIKGRMQKTQKIFAAMQNLMKDGMGYQAYFRKAQELYAKEGCPEEWKMHHQGETDRIWLQGIYSNTRDERCN